MLLADRPTTSRWTPFTGRTLLLGQADPRRQEPRPTLRPQDILAGVNRIRSQTSVQPSTLCEPSPARAPTIQHRDAFVHPEAGTSASDHLASGLIPIAIALLAMLAYPRLRAGVRGCIALVFGALALEAGIVDAVRHIMVNSISGDDVTGILAVLAG